MRQHDRGEEQRAGGPRSVPADASRPQQLRGLLGDPRLTAPGSRSVRASVARQAQHAAGNRAVEAVVAREAAAAKPKQKPKHLTWDEANRYVLTSEFVQPYLMGKVGTGLALKGEIHVESPAEFAKGYGKYAKGRKGAEPESRTHAYTEGTQTHIQEERGDSGTAIHEVVHHYGDVRWTSKVPRAINEGAAEFFARHVCLEYGIEHKGTYIVEHEAIQQLVDTVGMPALGKAYFQGDLAGLEAAVDTKKGVGTWGSFKKLMENEETFFNAMALF